MSTSHVTRIIGALGSDAIESELGLTKFSIRAAKRDGIFPARWYRPLRALCAKSGVECPDDAFRWVDTDKKIVQEQSETINLGKQRAPVMRRSNTGGAL